MFRDNVAKIRSANPPVCFPVTYNEGMSGETPTASADIIFGRRSFTGHSFFLFVQIRQSQLWSASGASGTP